MKFTSSTVAGDNNILANDHYVAIPYDCSNINANSDGIIPAGTIIPANDKTAIGVLLTDVVKAENPNGTIVIHGFIETSKLPAAPSEDTTSSGTTTAGAKTVLNMIKFI